MSDSRLMIFHMPHAIHSLTQTVQNFSNVLIKQSTLLPSIVVVPEPSSDLAICICHRVDPLGCFNSCIPSYLHLHCLSRVPVPKFPSLISILYIRTLQTRVLTNRLSTFAWNDSVRPPPPPQSPTC